MDKYLICVNTDIPCDGITLGNRYKVNEEYPECYTIKDDDGYTHNFSKAVEDGRSFRTWFILEDGKTKYLKCINEDDDDFKLGHFYEIVHEGSVNYLIHDEEGSIQSFSKEPDFEGDSYKTWFELIYPSEGTPDIIGKGVPFETVAEREDVPEPVIPLSDPVNHPEHYTAGGLETFDILKAKLSDNELRGYLIGNIIKYITRFEFKNGVEDLKKAQWYLDKLIELEGDSGALHF